MYHDTNFPPPIPAAGRLAQWVRMLEAFDRDEMEVATDLFIAHWDARDGDPDLEDDDRAGILMRADGVDYDPDEDDDRPDGLPGDPVDSEDDDPSGGAVDDEPHDPEEDLGAEERGEAGSWPESIAQGTGGHCYADGDHEDDVPAARRPFRDMIRRTQCETQSWTSPFDGKRWVEYRLRRFGPAPLRTASDLLTI